MRTGRITVVASCNVGLSLKGQHLPGLGETAHGKDSRPTRRFTQAVELLLKVLQQAPQPLKLVATGSVRDIVAAFNRDPDLLRKKLSKIYVNVGREALDGAGWNVHIDPLAPFSSPR